MLAPVELFFRITKIELEHFFKLRLYDLAIEEEEGDILYTYEAEQKYGLIACESVYYNAKQSILKLYWF